MARRCNDLEISRAGSSFKPERSKMNDERPKKQPKAPPKVERFETFELESSRNGSQQPDRPKTVISQMDAQGEPNRRLQLEKREASMLVADKAGSYKALKEIQRIVAAMKIGDVSARAHADGIDGEWGEALSEVNALLEAFSNIIDEDQRVRQALDGATSSVMIADADGVIRYANRSVLDMLQSAESDLRKDLPNLESAKILGSNIDVFHRDPRHQRRLLEGLTKPHRTQVVIGGRSFQLVASPIFDAGGKRVATSVEWVDRTIEVRIEKEIATAIEAAGRGDFDRHLDVSGAEGVFKLLGERINALLFNTGNSLAVIGEALNRIAEGDVSRATVGEFHGAFGKLKTDVEKVRGNVQDLMSELTYMSEEHDKGDIDVVIPVGKFQNDFARVAHDINAMVAGHIAVKKKAMACIAEFGAGNFEASLERFPGKKAFINQIVEQVRGNLKALNEDVDKLVTAAVEGRLQTRADSAKHQGDFRKIVQGMNDTLDSVTAPMTNIARAIEALGRNDMSVLLDGEFHGDFLAVKSAFDNALTGLNATMYQIVDAVEQVSQSADQLNSASQSMASTSEEQAAAVEEISSSLVETNSQVQANTENANAANQLVIGTSQAAAQGQAKMEEMTEAMNAINAASQNIGKIIKVIDEIAFQTNLLALNAAVEAARAGQHGRGFAVVAQEVRNLAGRSAKAARETADMIEDSVKRVGEGVNIAKETRDALNLIVVNVVKVKDLVAEIATASNEQSRGVSQISSAMTQVGKASQEGSQQAEELASASSELSKLASQMQDNVRRFNLRERGLSTGTGIPELNGMTAEMLNQLKALLANQQRPPAAAAKAMASGGSRKPASAIIALDQDERGFGGF